MPVPPFPVLPAPRTWSAGDPHLTPYLRADLGNAALLLANRPMFIGAQTTTGQALTGGAFTAVDIDTEYLDAYGQHVPPNPQWNAPLGGWYLNEGDTEIGAIAATSKFGVGMRVVQGASVTVTDAYCGMGPGNGSNSGGMGGATLAQLDPTTGDHCSMIAGPDANATVNSARFKSEWVAQPTSLGYGTGTVITSPQPAAMWPNGAGTVINNPGGIPAGATSMIVADPTGMVTGGVIGLDYLYGTAVSPLAEYVTITSVAGTTIGITATTYPHGGSYSPGAVAVPVSAAFMNQQVRDLIRFLCYPPIAHLYRSSGAGAASLPNQGLPSGTGITFSNSMVDNFGGWAGAGTGPYTFPVAGCYYLYGQVACAATASYTLTAGLALDGGTISWGSGVKNGSGTALQLTATVRQLVRVTAGETVQLYGSQNSGGSVSLLNAFQQTSRLIVVFRSF